MSTRPFVRVALYSEITVVAHALSRSLVQISRIRPLCEAASLEAAAEAVAKQPGAVLVYDGSSQASYSELCRTELTIDFNRLVVFGLKEVRQLRAYSARGVRNLVSATAPLTELCLAIEGAARDQPYVSPSLAVALLQMRDSAVNAAIRAPRDVPLTRQEMNVARLIAQQFHNSQVAEQLGISPATVKSHVHHILAKLHLSTRHDIARLFAASPPGAAVGEHGRTPED